MEKKKFKPRTIVLDVRKDLGIDQDVKIEVWEDPSRDVIFDLLSIYSSSRHTDDDGFSHLDELTPQQLNALNRRYFECASKILIDCDVAGIDFDTPESTEESFHNEDVPWGLWHMVLMTYIGLLSDEYSVLKNALTRVVALSNSGTESAENGEKSQEILTKQ